MLYSPTQIVLVFGSLAFAYWQLWLYLFSPRQSRIDKLSGERIKRLKKVTDTSRAHKRREVVQKAYAVIQEIPGLGLKSHVREEYVRYIITTDTRVDGALISPEEVRVRQVVYCFCVLIVALIAMIITPAGVVVLAVCGIAWKIPVMNMKDKYRINSVEIVKQFIEFYDMYYCQFISKDCVKKIYDICQAFMPIANPVMKQMLDRFMIDLEIDEGFALRELDYRYSDNKYIHKFCTVAKGRLQGDAASYATLSAFREELQNEKKLSLRRQLEKRKAKANAILGAMLIISFSIAMIVYLGCMLAAG